MDEGGGGVGRAAEVSSGVSRTQCSAQRCTADPGPRLLDYLKETGVPGLQRTTSLHFVLRCARDTRSNYAITPSAIFSQSTTPMSGSPAR